MREFEKKRKIKSRIYSTFSLIVLLIIAILILRGTVGVYLKHSQSQDKVDELSEQIQDFEKRKIYLEEQISDISSEYGVEKELREKFNIAKDGEEVIIILDDEGNEKEPNEPRGSFWTDLFGL